MRITIIAVGKRPPAWVEDNFREYSKRLPRELDVKLVEISPVTQSSKSSIEDKIKKETKAAQSVIPKNNLVVALDEHGKLFTSKQLAEKMDAYMQQGQDISIIIGGADGLGEAFLQSVNEVWSLSKMTLPHALVRTIIIEQIYRAWTINNKHPYHRE